MIRVISRKVPLYSSINFGMYVNKLSELVEIQPGFIKSESFWCRESNNIVSMSDWESKKDWENWFNSNERNKIVKANENFVQEEHFHTLHKTNKNFHNFFLL